jgi:hypothetical protein
MKRRRIDARAMPDGDLATDRRGPSVQVRLGNAVCGLSRADAVALRQRLDAAEAAFATPAGGSLPEAFRGRYPIKSARTLAEVDALHAVAAAVDARPTR